MKGIYEQIYCEVVVGQSGGVAVAVAGGGGRRQRSLGSLDSAFSEMFLLPSCQGSYWESLEESSSFRKFSWIIPLTLGTLGCSGLGFESHMCLGKLLKSRGQG